MQEQAEQMAAINSWLWHAIILACAVATVALLWHIAKRKRKESSALPPRLPFANAQSQPTSLPGYEKHQEAKQPGPPIPSHANRRLQSTAENDNPFHRPDSQCLPKN
jgi:hypothetical protein